MGVALLVYDNTAVPRGCHTIFDYQIRGLQNITEVPLEIYEHMNFLGELKHPCRHDAQNDSEVRKITHTFSIKKINISTTIYSFSSLLSLREDDICLLYLMK